MKTKEKIENNLDEVIFEKRNKEYGAYFLRKTYEKNVTRALTISITLLLLTVVIPLIANYIKDDRYFRGGPDQGPDVIVIGGAKDVIDPPPPPPPPPVLNDLVNKVKFQAFKVIDTAIDLGPVITQVELIDKKTNDPVDLNTIKVNPDQIEKKVIDDDVNKINEISGVSEKPEFPGGDEGLFRFVTDNIKYPDLARDNKIQGTVFISFVVEPDGSLTNFKTEHGIGAGCDEEAERVVKLMPKWTPGKQNNKGVRVRVVIPMKFVVMQ